MIKESQWLSTHSFSVKESGIFKLYSYNYITGKLFPLASGSTQGLVSDTLNEMIEIKIKSVNI